MIKINELLGMIRDKYNADEVTCSIKNTCIDAGQDWWDMNICVSYKNGGGFQLLSPRDVNDIKIGITLELAKWYVNRVA